MRALLIPLYAMALASCAPMQPPENVAEMGSARAELKRADGSVAGVATLSNRSNGVVLDLSADAPNMGAFGMHIHAVGKCEGPDFASAGPHWNPNSKQHGRDNPMGSHAGDLPNVGANSSGKLVLSQKLDGYVFDGPNGVLDADGASIIIHEKPDDYKTDPSGASGKRIICGIFEKG